MWNNSPPVHLLHHKGDISDTHAGGIKQRAFIWDMVCYLDTCIFIPVDTAYADRSFFIKMENKKGAIPTEHIDVIFNKICETRYYYVKQ